MSIIKYIARLLHDGVAHPLIAVTNGAAWAHRFHDWIGVIWASPNPSRSIVIRGESPFVGQAADILEAAGFLVIDAMHDVAHVVSPYERDAILLHKGE